MEEFKREACGCTDASGHAVAQVAADLSIGKSTLTRLRLENEIAIVGTGFIKKRDDIPRPATKAHALSGTAAQLKGKGSPLFQGKSNPGSPSAEQLLDVGRSCSAA